MRKRDRREREGERERREIKGKGGCRVGGWTRRWPGRGGRRGDAGLDLDANVALVGGKRKGEEDAEVAAVVAGVR